jgi:hypothetical protein
MVQPESGGRARSGVYPMLVSEGLFAVMVEAIAELSLRRGSFATLRDVVSLALERGPPDDPAVLDQMRRMAPLEGQTRIYLRLYNDQLAKLETFKANIAEQMHGNPNTREMVCICCLLLLRPLG